MDVDVRGPLDHALERRVELATVDDVRFEQHAGCVERAQRQQARAQHRRHFPDPEHGRLRVLADVDRVRRAKRRGHRVMLVVNEHELLAGGGIAERDPTRIAGR